MENLNKDLTRNALRTVLFLAKEILKTGNEPGNGNTISQMDN